MGLFDKVKKALGGEKPASGGAAKQGGAKQGSSAGARQGSAGQRPGRAPRQEGGAQGGQGGGQRQGGQGGGQRQGGQGDGGQGGSGTGRRRGSRGGRGRGGQGGGQQKQGGEGTQRDEQQGAAATGEGGSGGQASNASRNRRRRGSRGGSGSSSSGGQGGTTRKVTRSDAAERKEAGEGSGGEGGRSGGRSGEGRSGGRKRSGSGRGRSGRGGSGGGGGQGGGRRRERTRRGSSSSGSRRRVLDANERPKEPVKKQILINASDPNEIRVAIREKQKVVEAYVERKGKRSLAGNIYKGRVQNVLPGMEAAFVDIGLERNGFLYVDEVTPAAADSDQIMKVTVATEMANTATTTAADDPATSSADVSPDEAAAAAAGADAGAGAPTMEMVGSDEDPMEVAAANVGEQVDIEGGAGADETLDIDDAIEEKEREEAEEAKAAESGEPKQEKPKGRGRARIQNKKKIQELLRPGQEILCQVVKDPMGTKGSRLTTQYSLAGRYLVYVPDGEGLGVSRRLEEAERNRLRDIVKQFELPAGGGLIVRTAAEGALEENIAKDLQLLLTLHEQLMDKAGQARAPKLLYNEADLSLRIIRDLFNDEVEEVVVDEDRHFQRIMGYLKRTSPELAERVKLYDGQRPLFESYGVEEAIRSTLSKRAELPSGGYLIIDYAEAFTVIDVNTGRNVGKASLEETITKTNMEAAEEVVRQLRLRDIGGIIVVDFIDMNLMKNRDTVLEHFRLELSKDRTKTYLVEISPLGLVEMTRQNVSDGVREILTSTCRTCEGRGVLVSAETHAIEVERAMVELAAGLGDDVEAMAVEADPEVAKVLAGNQGRQVELNRRVGKTVRVFGDPDLPSNTFALRAKGAQADILALADPLQRGEKHKVVIERVDPSCEEDGIATIDGVMVTVIGAGDAVGEEKTVLIAASSGSRAFATLVRPARRRRRRGGRGRRRGTAGGTGTQVVDGVEEELDDDELDGDLEEGDDAADGDDFDEDDDFEDVEEDDAAAAEADEEEAGDDHTEIPQRLVMLDEQGAEEEDDDLEDDEDEDDDEADEEDDDDLDEDDDEVDEDDEDVSDGDTGSDGSNDEPHASADDEASGDASGSGDDRHDDGDHDSQDGDQVSVGGALEATGGDEGNDTPMARRGASDEDELSIDVDGADDLLSARGVAVPAGVASTSRPEATASSSAGGEAGGGDRPAGQRRRRRGSRGGRNRNRNRPGGEGGGTQGDGGAGGGSGGSGDQGGGSGAGEG